MDSTISGDFESKFYLKKILYRFWKKALNFVEMLNICIFVFHLEVIQHWKNCDVVFEDEGLTILVFLGVFMGHPICRVRSIFYTTYYYI